MPFYADLHIHSKYSRATSRDCDLENLAWWARRKGIAVVGTGDFTHPAWFDEIRTKLVPAEPGLFRLRPELEREVDRHLPTPCRGATRFLLEVEISTIYKKGDKTRKVHHLIYASNLETAGRFRERLAAIGNIASDGRPILGLDSRDLLEITLESGDDAYLVPAHIWTPWFAAMGSKSGFDSIEDCYGDLADHIFAVETGLSSDPPMNWRVSSLDRFTLVSNSDAHSPPMLGREACVFATDLDYFAIRGALESGEGYGGTVEFFPEEGKYHLDGHRSCQVRLEPEETRQRGGACPECGKPLTVGVQHRVEALADRPADHQPEEPMPFRSLVPLPEVVSELRGVGPKSKTVGGAVARLVDRLGPELDILERVPLEEIGASGEPVLEEALRRLRAGEVHRQAGYDGEYGVIRLFEESELERRLAVPALFEPPPVAPPSPAAEPEPKETATPAAQKHSHQAASRGASAAQPPSRQETPEDLPVSPFLAALDRDQRAAAARQRGQTLILAGPGAGKTRTLTHRLAHLVAECEVPAENCLAITFTRRAAEGMRRRLAALLGQAAHGIQVTTFHGLGLRLLRELAPRVGLPASFAIAAPKQCRALLQEIEDVPAGEAGRLLEAMGRRRRERAAHGPDGSPPPENRRLDEALARYESALATRELVDFEGLLQLPLRALEADPELLERIRRRFDQISIDEYQDIDALQYRLIRLLAPADANLLAIGDPDQSIYRFRGSEVGFFLRFQEDYPDSQVVHLYRNYRSSPVLVEASLEAITPGSLVPGRRLVAARSDVREPIVMQPCASPGHEAEEVVKGIERLLGGTSYFSLDSGRVTAGEERELSFGDFAVLYRTKAQARPIAEALARAGIPTQERSHQRLAEHPAVERLLAMLTLLTGEPGELGGDVSVEAWLQAAAERLRREDPEVAVDAALDRLTPLALRRGSDLPAFLAELSLGEEIDTWDPRAERVSLLTLHAAKGLEFPVVFLVGCEDGLLPMRLPGRELEPADLAEERRLFFVGMTRAENLLFLSHAARRSVRGQREERRPSPFLDDLGRDKLDQRAIEKAPAGAAKRRQLRLF